MTAADGPGQQKLPSFEVGIAAPDLSPWLDGNTGIPGFTSYAAAAPGPHLLLMSLIHGNEIAGAIVLDRLLRGGFRPARGRLTLGFANLAAFARFDPEQPTASRFLDEDLNRLWDDAVLDGPRQSSELSRARQIRRALPGVDVLLDLHSMLWASEPLILSGPTGKGRALGLAIGTPPLVVGDTGHVAGRRLIDYAAFADPAAAASGVLVEAGQHWNQATVAQTLATVAALLRRLGMAGDHAALPPAGPAAAPRFAEVTAAITAGTASFSFMQAYRGGDLVARANTLIAMDGGAEIRTPYDDCLLVMPSLRPSRGHTAVRLARLAPLAPPQPAS